MDTLFYSTFINPDLFRLKPAAAIVSSRRAGSVVTKDIPDYGVAVRVPAKVIKMQNPDEQKEEVSSENE